jgi:protein CpxP
MKYFLFLVLASALSTTLLAQTTDSTQQGSKTPASPAMRAAHRLTTLTKQLRLNENQVEKIRSILADATVSLDSLRNHPTGQRRQDGQARRGVAQDTDAKISAVLSNDQRAKYELLKEEQRQKRKGKKGLQSDADSSPNP